MAELQIDSIVIAYLQTQLFAMAPIQLTQCLLNNLHGNFMDTLLHLKKILSNIAHSLLYFFILNETINRSYI